MNPIEFLEWLARPAWLIDDQLEIAGMNARGRECLRTARPMRESSGRLGPASHECMGAFSTCVSKLMQRSERGEDAPRDYLRLAGPATALSMTLFGPGLAPSLPSAGRRFLVMLHQADQGPEPDTQLWQAALGLTPAEARACRHLYDGHTVKEISVRLGITAHTVKTQLNCAYSKTGARNRVEMVQLLRSLA